MTTQHDEEAAILEFFPDNHIGQAVEVGAGDGATISTTLTLEQRGWRVLCVEPNPGFHWALEPNRKLVENVACADLEGEEEFLIYPVPGAENGGVVGTLGKMADEFRQRYCQNAETPVPVMVPVRRLDDLLEKHGFKSPVDFLSIDTDGSELRVLKGAGLEKWKPELILIEDTDRENSGIGEFLMDHGYELHDTGFLWIGEYNDLWRLP